MSPPVKFQAKSQIILSTVLTILAFIILYISLARASYKLMTIDNNENKLRKNPIEYTMIKDNNPEMCVYKLPEVRTLPSNPLYKVKQVRDFMWVNFSRDPLEKAQILLLLADKKMTETILLADNQNFNLALATSEEAVNKLKYADTTISEIKDKSIEVKELEKQIIKAGCAYRKVLIKINRDNKLDEEKYKKIISDLEKWNEE